MKNSNVEPHGLHAAAATRGQRSALLAGAKGMTWRDSSTESIGQIRDMTVVGLTFIDNEDGTGILSVGSGGGASGGSTPPVIGTGPILIIEAGSSEAIDLSVAAVFYIVLTEDLTLSFSGAPAAGTEGRWRFFFKQAGSGSYTVTWPASVRFRDTDGTQTTTAPALATAVGAGDTFEVTTVDGGVTYGASLENGSNGGGASALDDLTDVTLTAPSADDTLRYVGGVWVNDNRRWEAVTDGEDVFVWESDDLVHEWKAY